MAAALETKKRKAIKEPTYLTEQEVEHFFRVIHSVRDRALFRVIYHRGLRVSEPARLTLADYRPGPGRARLMVRRCKGSVTAEHALVDLEAAAMRAWIRVRGEYPGPLFPSRHHRPIDGSTVRKLMLRYCTLAGIARDKAHPHALKHSCGTHLVKLLNGNIVQIQDHLGHAQISSTMRYIRASAREVRGDLLADWGKR